MGAIASVVHADLAALAAEAEAILYQDDGEVPPLGNLEREAAPKSACQRRDGKGRARPVAEQKPPLEASPPLQPFVFGPWAEEKTEKKKEENAAKPPNAVKARSEASDSGSEGLSAFAATPKARKLLGGFNFEGTPPFPGQPCRGL